MVLDGKRVISETTENNGRLLSVFCILIIAADIYHLHDKSWEIFSNTIPPEVFNGLTPVLLAGLTFSYVLHWWVDHVSFVNWFKKSEIIIGTIGKMGSVNNTEDSLTALKGRLDRLANEIPKIKNLEESAKIDGKTLSAQQVAEATQILISNMAEVMDALQGLGKKFEYVKGAGFLLVYIWYLVVPITLVGLAVFSLCIGFSA